MKARAYLTYALPLAVILAFAVAGLPAAAMDAMTVRITNAGIMTGTDNPSGGLYLVTVKNETCAARGIVLKGGDRAVSQYLRFSKVLEPGEYQTFRWYFPANRNVKMRDLLCCTHAERTCVVASFGDFTKALHFG